MMFNMGRPRFSGFKKFIAGVNANDWMEAGRQMEDSRWYRQVTNRAKRLKVIMNIIEHICNMDIKKLHDLYWSVWQKLEHNQNHFFKRSHSARWNKLMEFLSR